MNDPNPRGEIGICILVLLSATLACEGCAIPSGRTPASPMTPTEAHHYCVGQMYSDRSSRGRSAVNWQIYDYCMKQHG